MQERSSLIVYFKSPKVLKRIKKMGNVTYFNKKRKYAVLYINKDDEAAIVKELRDLRHIRKVDDSKLDYSPYSMLEDEIEPANNEESAQETNDETKDLSSDTMSSKNP